MVVSDFGFDGKKRDQASNPRTKAQTHTHTYTYYLTAMKVVPQAVSASRNIYAGRATVFFSWNKGLSCVRPHVVLLVPECQDGDGQ